MGNCQATEAAAVLIQHPGGKVDRLYWPTSASEVMKSNPGHYVALVTLYVSEEKAGGGGGTTRFTRVRLLKPKEALSLGNVYRLVTSQEVAKALRARKLEKLKKNQEELFRRQQPQGSGTDHDRDAQMVEDGRQHNGSDTMDQDMIHLVGQQRQRSSSNNTQSAAARSRQWRPTLQSITEAGT